MTTMSALDKLKNSDALLITPAQACEVLGVDPNTLRWQAKAEPAALGFPVIVVKSRTYIPRIPFIQFLTGGSHDQTVPANQTGD